MRIFTISLLAVALVAPMITITAPADAKRVYKEWRGRDGRMYCSRADGTTGLIVGDVRGAQLGRTIDTRRVRSKTKRHCR